MAYAKKYSKARRAVRKPATYSRSQKTPYKKPPAKLGKTVEKLVAAELKKQRRGTRRSVLLSLKAAHFDREVEDVLVRPLEKWVCQMTGPFSQHKYAILPVSEAIPLQRLPHTDADDRYGTHNRVRIKGVSLRAVVNHAEGVRLMAFAFRNPMRRDADASKATRPFIDAAMLDGKGGGKGPMTELLYHVMSKEELMNSSRSEHGFRNLGYTDGPFKVVPKLDDSFDWKSTDGSSFQSRLNQGVGGPIGTIRAKVGETKPKRIGKVFNKQWASSGMQRQFIHDPATQGIRSYASTRTRVVELFIELNTDEHFIREGEPYPVGQSPIEIFMGFDSPNSSGDGLPVIESGGIVGMDMEIYFSS